VYERTLLDIDLREISPTPFPAYLNSEVGKRSIMKEKNIKTKEERKKEKLKWHQLMLRLRLVELEGC